jgi:hypothetical protein
MLHSSEYHELGRLDDRLSRAEVMTPALMSDVLNAACIRFASMRHTGHARQLGQMIQSGAWTDASLALIEIELPEWHLRRIAYDDGEWHCALSNQREMPEWLDQSIETHHASLPVAILSAFVRARRDCPSPRASVPEVRRTQSAYEPMCCDNFS